MPLILAGKLANALLRADATDDESISAARCDELLASSQPSVGELSALIASLEDGAAARFLERKGLRLPASGSFDLGTVHLDIVCPRHGNANHVSSVSQSRSTRCPSPPRRPASPNIPSTLNHPTSTYPTNRPNAAPELTMHYCSLPLVSGSLWHVIPEIGIGHDTYVVSPALELVIDAKNLSFGRTVLAGKELCGTYLADGFSSTCLFDIPSATTIAELIQGVRALVRRSEEGRGQGRMASGLSRCRAALPFVLENSASPMESIIAAYLIIPMSRGGWGIKGLGLNERVDLSADEARIAGQPFLRPDGLVIPARVGYEYDSQQFHTDEGQSLRDRLRLTSAQFGGITLLPLTWDVVRDEVRFDAFCAEFAQMTGKRLRGPNGQTLRRRRELRRELGLPVQTHPTTSVSEDLVPVDVYERSDPWLAA